MEPFSLSRRYVYVLAGQILNLAAVVRIVTRNKQTLVGRSKSHPCRVICGLALSVFAQCAHAQSTTIVVWRTPTEITIAADSLSVRHETKVNSSGQSIQTTRNTYVCKIVKVGQRAVTFTGWAPLTVIPRAKLIAAKSLEAGGSLIDARNDVQRAIGQRLRDGLEGLRLSDITEYRAQTLLEGTDQSMPVLYMLFFEIQSGTPTILLQEWRALNKETEPVLLASPYQISSRGDETDKESKGRFSVLAGYVKEINRYKKDYVFWNKYGGVKGARKLVGIMKDARPKNVGGPIDVLRITKDGAKWIGEEPKCDENGERILKAK